MTTRTVAAQVTISHDRIREWAEARKGKPARVEGTGDVLRIDFGEGSSERLEAISWEEFFERFEAENLAFLYEEETEDSELSHFNRLINRD